MKKIGRIILFLLVTAMLLSGCSGDKEKQDNMKICGSFAVPGMLASDLKGTESEVNILEEDKEGRILFKYTTDNFISEERDTVLVICQKYDSEHVYFYEDICYILSDCNGADIANLKEKNDWNKPLDEEKMSGRRNRQSFDGFIVIGSQLEYNRISSAVCRAADIDEDSIKELAIVDIDYNGKELYFLSEKNMDVVNKYFVIVDEAYNTAFLKIENSTVNSTELSEFKKANEWHYGVGAK